jgi:class 3 adenylate cyclase
VSSGPVVAGNVGTEWRYEYTVVGDAVNEAARLTEAA